MKTILYQRKVTTLTLTLKTKAVTTATVTTTKETTTAATTTIEAAISAAKGRNTVLPTQDNVAEKYKNIYDKSIIPSLS